MRLLISYYWFKDFPIGSFMREKLPELPDIFADSGAYSAYRFGKVLDVEAYADWLHQWKPYFCTYANLDIKGDLTGSMRNLARLEARGLHPLPVFHGGEPMEYLKELCGSYDYIGLGGIAGASVSNKHDMMYRFMTKCFETAGSKVGFHCFGMSNLRTLRMFPWKSVDATSWGSAYRYGQYKIFNPRSSSLVVLTQGRKDQWFKWSGLVRSYGFDPMEFADRKNHNLDRIVAFAAISFGRIEQWISGVHGKRVKLYLAEASDNHLPRAARALYERGMMAYGDPYEEREARRRVGGYVPPPPLRVPEDQRAARFAAALEDVS